MNINNMPRGRKKGVKLSKETKKKMSESCKGHKVSEETRKKISEGNKGRKAWNKGILGEHHSKKCKEKISKALKGKKYPNRKKPPPCSKEHKKNISEALIGHKHSEETKKKIGESNKDKFSKEKNPNWKGGISNNPYPKEFNAKLKLKIRKRDNFICCLCGRTEREELEELNQVLCVNHIDFDKNNCNEKNLNTLCLRCNVKINRKREYWINYFNKN